MKKNIIIIILSIIILILVSYIVYDKITYHDSQGSSGDSCPIPVK